MHSRVLKELNAADTKTMGNIALVYKNGESVPGNIMEQIHLEAVLSHMQDAVI